MLHHHPQLHASCNRANQRANQRDTEPTKETKPTRDTEPTRDKEPTRDTGLGWDRRGIPDRSMKEEKLNELHRVGSPSSLSVVVMVVMVK